MAKHTLKISRWAFYSIMHERVKEYKFTETYLETSRTSTMELISENSYFLQKSFVDIRLGSKYTCALYHLNKTEKERISNYIKGYLPNFASSIKEI